MEEEAGAGRQEELLLWESEPQPESIVSVTLARAMTSLLSSRPKKLHDSISRLSPQSRSQPPSTASLEDSLWFFHSYVTDAANNNRSVDQLLLPIIHSVLNFRHFFTLKFVIQSFQSCFHFCNTVSVSVSAFVFGFAVIEMQGLQARWPSYDSDELALSGRASFRTRR